MNRNLSMQQKQSGIINPWLVVSISLIVVTLGLAGTLFWALTNYFDQKDNVDTKVSTAVTTAVKKQADADAKNFEILDKLPNRQFAGPEDFGALSFNYPKTWSTYIAKDAQAGVYQAYLNPVSVPAVTSTSQYALRVTIETKDYNVVLNSYQQAIKKGDLKSSPVKINGVDGTRIEGAFTKDIRGSAVVFKLRDKTVTIRTDADTFKGDFDALVASITFNA